MKLCCLLLMTACAIFTLKFYLGKLQKLQSHQSHRRMARVASINIPCYWNQIRGDIFGGGVTRGKLGPHKSWKRLWLSELIMHLLSWLCCSTVIIFIPRSSQRTWHYNADFSVQATLCLLKSRWPNKCVHVSFKSTHVHKHLTLCTLMHKLITTLLLSSMTFLSVTYHYLLPYHNFFYSPYTNSPILLLVKRKVKLFTLFCQ